MFIVLIEPACRSYFAVRGICIFFAETVCANGIIKNDCFAGFYGMRLFVERDEQFDTRGMFKVLPLIFLSVILE